ncbi:hypothetical protein TOT_010001137 [Theileria orientalis strain Shintoku]|uniref:Uncharacterized protein n=1 Tax=Theileria orientalis strain Shintoku TaxID=869250 RepID=J4C7V2_THEOR|nr:hypothetical protein TOT_010001137 [Theileria orientalis strain Shintoku]BAM39683.1 hypothetical protein TOT_010001137 [Theileria orientalis strain Shintoku]|eukprot:XP_009689984.1 hypothetical protein TOT_010001137 [Theileria orientalis strain Shintoku]
MCNYTTFLTYILNKNESVDLIEHRRGLEKNHKTLEMGLKTLSYLLCVKSEEEPPERNHAYQICEYFNGDPPQRIVNLLSGLEEKKVEEVVLEVAKLLEANAGVGLQPILSKLHFEVNPKEFYSRTVVLLLNLTVAAHRRFRNSFGSEENLRFTEEDRRSFESVQEWKEEVFGNNVTFTLCKLTLAMCVFGTDEAGLFESYNDLPGGLLSLFPNDLWIYVLGSYPVLCFDSTYLLSIKARGKYVTVISDQCYELIQNLVACQNFNIYLYDQMENFGTDVDHTVNVLVMSNWIDYLYKYAQSKVAMCNNKDRTQCKIVRSWLSKLLSNKLVLTMIEAVFKYNSNMCINTLVKLAEVNDSIVFLQHMLFKREMRDNVRLGILSRLNLSIIAKDALSTASIMNYLIRGLKTAEKGDYYRIWKRYLKDYANVEHNRGVVDGLLEQMMDYLVNEKYEHLEFPPEVFRSDVRRVDVKEKKFMEERMEALKLRNMLRRLVEVLGFEKHRSKLVRSIEEGYETAKKSKHSNEDLAKIEFAMYLIYALKMEAKYGNIYEMSVNNGYMLFYKYLRAIEGYVGSESESESWMNEEGEVATPDLEEEYHSYLVYYYTNRIIEQNNKEVIFFLNNFVSAKEGGEGPRRYRNAKTVTHALESLASKYVDRLVQNVLDQFQDSAGNNSSTLRLYLKQASLYVRVYEFLHKNKATQDMAREFGTGEEASSSGEAVSRYIKQYSKVVPKAMGILIKQPHLLLKYPELLKVPLAHRTKDLLKILDFSRELTGVALEVLLNSFKYLGEEYVKPVKEFVVDLSEKMTSEGEWSLSHVALFEKLVRLVTKMVASKKYLNGLMSEEQGSESLKKTIVVANRLATEESRLRIATNKMNIAIVDTLLSLRGVGEKGEERRELRTQEFATKELEQLLTSQCGKFEILDEKRESRLALGALSDGNTLANMVNGTLSSKDSGTGINKENGSKVDQTYKIGNVEERKRKRESEEKGLFENHLIHWNLVTEECMDALEFIAKMYMGFQYLPQTKLLLISEYFFFHGATMTNMESREIKRRLLSGNNTVKWEASTFIYEFNKAKQKKAYT